jgi:hypothetical protein
MCAEHLTSRVQNTHACFSSREMLDKLEASCCR